MAEVDFNRHVLKAQIDFVTRQTLNILTDP